MRCSDIMERLEQLSPLSYAMEWDNCGLLCGRREKEVNVVMLAVDATDDVIEQAVLQNVDMLITHHPMIFDKLNKISSDHFIGRRIVKLIRNDISYYAMHTNFDVMGMADAAADEIGLKKREVLDITYEDDIAKEGFGRMGLLPQIMTLNECALYCKRVFKLNEVSVYGDLSQTIERAAIVPGSGKDFIETAINGKADVLITGDITHHSGIDAVLQGLSIIDAGHYGTEKIFKPYIAEVFRREMPQINICIAKEENPFQII